VGVVVVVIIEDFLIWDAKKLKSNEKKSYNKNIAKKDHLFSSSGSTEQEDRLLLNQVS
jgi:hypothetical protein